MRVIFEGPPIRVARILPNQDSRVDGTAHFVATVFEPGEQMAAGCGSDAPLLSYWRSGLRPGEGLRAGEPFDGLPALEVPRSLVDGLPDDARLALSWIWTQLGI